EHGERYFVTRLVFGKIDVPGVVNGADHILYAVRHLERTVGAGGGAGFAVEAHVVIDLVPAFTDVADKTDRQQGGRIDVAFIAVAHFEDPVVRPERAPVPNHMIGIAAAVSLQFAGKNGFSGAYVNAAEVIVHFICDGFTGMEARVGDTTEIILC